MDRRSLLRLIGLAPAAVALPQLPAVAAPIPAPVRYPAMTNWAKAFAEQFAGRVQADIYYIGGKVSSVPLQVSFSDRGAVRCHFLSPLGGTVQHVIIRRGMIGLVKVSADDFDTPHMVAGTDIILTLNAE